MEKTLKELTEMFKQNGFEVAQIQEILNFAINKVVQAEENTLLNEKFIASEGDWTLPKFESVKMDIKAFLRMKEEHFKKEIGSATVAAKIMEGVHK